MNIIIDIGNTRTKLAVFDRETLVESEAVEGNPVESIKALASRLPIEAGVVSSVTDVADDVAAALSCLPFPLMSFTAATPVPITNCYRTPQTLGTDRLAAAVGAAWLFEGSYVMIVDAGSCVTFDFVDEKGQYMGGNIAPGIRMRLTAMHEHTRRLPQIETEGELPDTGYDTETALRSGAVRGLQHEIEGYAGWLRKRTGRLTIVLTGGDCDSLHPDIDVPIYTEHNLVAYGLNRVLLYNKEELA
ncbi:MAG: type III pantothenate kinase [Bacteroidaceae bacterium]|nr:type III pantothenate kinase [Bacteroidaceae bacterium]